MRYLLLLTLILPICGCASKEKDEKPPKRDSSRKWYQGTMDTEERTFFIDSFFDGR